MKELLAIIIVLLIYISIQLTNQQKEPVKKPKKHIVKHVTNNVNEIEVLHEAPKQQQVIERTPNIKPNGTTGIISGLTSKIPFKKTLNLLFILESFY